MEKTKEQLLARKQEIMDFLAKHYQKDPSKMENFKTKYPDYSSEEPSVDPSAEVLEFQEYETNLAIEQSMENELLEIEEKLAAM